MTDTIAPYDLAEKFWAKAHVRPVGSQIVIVPIVEERIRTETKGGIFIDLRISHGGVDIPDSVDNQPLEGRVVALGDGMVDVIPDHLIERLAARVEAQTAWGADGFGTRESDHWKNVIRDETTKRRPFRVKIGDRVMFIPWNCITIQLEGTDFHICDEAAVIGWVAD
jgi:co-chaperonin GroES (HSP10)